MNSTIPAGPERRWVDTGHTERVDNLSDRLPEFDPRTGEHLWIVTTVYRVNPAQWTDPARTPVLDHENLLSVMGPMCWHCEQPYTPGLAKRRCRGEG